MFVMVDEDQGVWLVLEEHVAEGPADAPRRTRDEYPPVLDERSGRCQVAGELSPPEQQVRWRRRPRVTQASASRMRRSASRMYTASSLLGSIVSVTMWRVCCPSQRIAGSRSKSPSVYGRPSPSTPAALDTCAFSTRGN